MTDDDYRAWLRLEILRRLDRVPGGSLEEPILFADTNQHITPRSELTDFRRELVTLEETNLIVVVRDNFTGRRRISITTQGVAKVGEHNAP